MDLQEQFKVADELAKRAYPEAPVLVLVDSTSAAVRNRRLGVLLAAPNLGELINQLKAKLAIIQQRRNSNVKKITLQQQIKRAIQAVTAVTGEPEGGVELSIGVPYNTATVYSVRVSCFSRDFHEKWHVLSDKLFFGLTLFDAVRNLKHAWEAAKRGPQPASPK
jgi:hypothetical protein